MTTEQEEVSFPSFGLEGRLAVVTGASEGIGRSIAQAFARRGAYVVLASRRADRLETVCKAIEAEGGHCEAVATDVTRLEDLRRLAATAEARVRERNLDLVVVNNAGFGFTKPALEITEAEWDLLIDTHLKGTFFCCQQLAGIMIARNYGKIINLSSTWSVSADTGKSAYCAAKAGISHLTAALACEWAPSGVRVNALAPTTTMTDFTTDSMQRNPKRAEQLRSRIKLGRFAEPQDLLGGAIFLASAASDFVTGQTLFVDGGFTI